MMTLLALALAVGIVIDDAIVVLENIYRFIDEKKMKPFPAAIHATKEIGLAVLATTLSLMAVFLPVAFMSGIVGRFLLQLRHHDGVRDRRVDDRRVHADADDGRAHAAAAAARRARSAASRGSSAAATSSTARSSACTPRVLAFCLRHRWVVGVAIVGSCATTSRSCKKVGGDFLPPNDEAQFEIYVQTPEGTTLEATTLDRRAARAPDPRVSPRSTPRSSRSPAAISARPTSAASTST